MASPHGGRLGSSAAIEVRDLTKRYRNTDSNALDGISFDVPQGALFCLLGPNGAGKTTTVSILTTTLTRTSGRVRIAGLDLDADQARVRAEVGVVFQGPSLDLNLTAEENVRLHAVLYGLYPWRPLYRLMPQAYRAQVDQLSEVLGVSDFLGRRVRTLSEGTRRKLEIVRSLMHRPSVLFLDEPTVGLDPEARRSLWNHLHQVRESDGTTIFLTTHYLEEAETADTTCFLSHGRVIELGSPAEVKARHVQPALVLDSTDRERLRDELDALGLAVSGRAVSGRVLSGRVLSGTEPLRVALDGRSAQGVLAAITSELTEFRVVEPTLEDTYLQLLERSES